MALFHQVRAARDQAKAEKVLKDNPSLLKVPQRVSSRDGIVPSAAVVTGAGLLAWMGRRDMSISQFSELTGMTRKTVSKHLASDELPKLVTLAIRGLEA